MKTLSEKPFLLAAALAVAPLVACSSGGDDVATAGAGDETITAALGDADDLSALRQALDKSGIASALDGPGSYTLLAPHNAAFDSLGADGAALLENGQKPILVALLRDHMVPGSLTADDIGSAIDSNDGRVEMRTLGEGLVSFSRTGDTIAVTGPDGATAALSGKAIAASNGIILPVDGFVKLPPNESQFAP